MTFRKALPRLLILAPDLPYPQKAGGQMRMMSIIDAMSSCAQLHVLARTNILPEETIRWCDTRGFSIANLPWPNLSILQKILKKISAILSAGVPKGDPETQMRIDTVIREFKPDLIWTETPYLLPYILNRNNSIPVITDFWGTSEGAERNLKRAKGIRRLWHHYHCHAARRFERRIIPKLAIAVVVSQHLADLLRKTTGFSNIRVVPIALINHAGSYASAIHSNKDPSIILSGAMSFPPNVDAAKFMITEILPYVVKSCPNIRIILAGSNPSDEIRNMAVRNRITVTGTVENLAPLIERSSLYALPMRLGSGIRTKLLEVFPTGTPIVTTSIGAEGYDLINSENCLIADNAKDFAVACIRLLTDRQLAARLGRNAQNLAKTVQTQEQVKRIVQGVINECLTNISYKSNNIGPQDVD